ncbi:hypothetical protein G7043_22310 [Lentzea sp. NEAU-D13]|uniref:LGFP repeat-containing protein n=1 Tax=Lentzea alba TaxID=2714351 RepID=A0A7C9RT96_9PSEU|nr:hypothetical protein [Lentzea alba]NGY61666.1 hypothetical protein [Lentzea alba]
MVAAFVAATVVVPGTAHAAEWETSPVRAKWQALGGASFAGEKVGDEVVLENGIRWAKFAKYDIVITWREGAGAHWMSGAVSRLWLGTSPATSAAIMDQVPVSRGAQLGAATAYDTGYSVYYSDAYGAHAIGGAARDKYWANGSVTGRFGWPISGVVDVYTGAKEQRFSEAVSFYQAPGQAQPYWISGALRDRYFYYGLDKGPQGPLRADQVEQPGNGWKAQFESGAIYWSAAAGAHMLNAEMNDTYQANSGPVGAFGYPKTDTSPRTGDSGSGNIAEFTGNVTLYQGADVGGAYWMGGPVRDKYEENWRSPYGQKLYWPTSNQTSAPGTDGQYVLFGADTVLLWGPRTGGHAIRGEALRKLRAGGDVAVYGLPQFVNGTEYGQNGFVQFERASIFVTESYSVTIGWEFRDVWWLTGGGNSTLGPAREDQHMIEPGVWVQGFQHGWIVCDYNIAECRYGKQITAEEVRREGTRVAIARR